LRHDSGDRTPGRDIAEVAQMDIGEAIRKQVMDAVGAALGKIPDDVDAGSTTVASTTNVSSSRHSVSVYVDDEVTIVERDGKRRVIRHDEDDGAEDTDGGRPTG
jgi:hypothetical protein